MDFHLCPTPKDGPFFVEMRLWIDQRMVLGKGWNVFVVRVVNTVIDL